MNRRAEPDGAALESLLETVLVPAYGYALRLARNPGDAEDLVQEAAYQACRGFHGFARGTNFKAWFFRILVNCFYYRHRRRRREPEMIEVEEVAELHVLRRATERGLVAEGADPASKVLAKLEGEHIAGALAELPEEFREVCALYFMEDFS